jgi:hypothetical protein
MYDTDAIAEILPRPVARKRKRQSLEIMEKQLRGERALTLCAALVDELLLLEVTGEFYAFEVPLHQHAKLKRYILQRIIGCAEQHLHIKTNGAR